jgi:DNA polymerase I
MYPKERNKSGQILRFFDDETGKIIDVPYKEEHRPFFYTTLTPSQIMQIEKVQQLKFVVHDKDGKLTWNRSMVVSANRIDIIHPRSREKIKVTKVVTTKPQHVTNNKWKNGLSQLIAPEFVYNNHVKYHEVFCYDNDLSMGMPYNIETMELDVDWKAIKKHPIYTLPEVESYKGKMPKKAFDWLTAIFTTPFPEFKHHLLAIDIECDFNYRDAIDAFEAVAPISSVTLSWYRNDEMIHLTFVLTDSVRGTKATKFDKKHEYHIIREFNDERTLIKECVQYLVGMPQKFVVGFNVDEFDFPYLCSRMNYLGIKNDKIWGYKQMIEIDDGKTYERINKGVTNKYLIDLYRFFSNPSIKNYAFKAKYERNTLNSIGSALLEKEKYDYEGRITNLETAELCYYNAQDNALVLELCVFDNEIAMQLIMMTMRLATKAIEDACRSKVASVILNLMRRFLVYNKMVNMNRYELDQVGSYHSESITGKKFAGAIVLDPIMGTHFNLVVADVASLYPTMIVNHNLSYDTMNCNHPECTANVFYATASCTKEELTDLDPLKEKTHHVCTKFDGTFSTMVGFVKDVRVYYFKLYKDLEIGYKAVEQYLKVIVNASYGVNAFERFPFFCAPAAEITTATGRQTILSIKQRFEEIGALVIGGDTDSVFLTRLKEEDYDELVVFIKENYSVDLEVEEKGIVIVFHAKKNYFIVELKRHPSSYDEIRGIQKEL